METKEFNPILEKINYPNLEFYIVKTQYFDINKNCLIEKNYSFYTYNEAKEFYNKIPLN
jgi:hypothetical protein